MDFRDKFEYWLSHAADVEVKQQLEQMRGDETKILDSFYKDLEFGTAGQRGLLGAGTNCLNIYTVGKTTAGLAKYILESGLSGAVFISYDSRINSKLFAETAACVLASFGIPSFLTISLQPTPFVSFGVRELGCCAGIMITASHNPAEFNGYKVYGADGCQMGEEAAAAVSRNIAGVNPFELKTEPLEKYLESKTVQYVSEDTIEKFLKAVWRQHLCSAAGVKIVYSPLNGTGYKLVPEILKRAGVPDLVCVNEQSMPDGNFPTCPYPNPEKMEALALGLKYAEKIEADMLIATDPDCDRVGIAVRHNGKMQILTGNEMGLLLTDFVLTVRKKAKTLTENPIVIKTIVTTSLADKIAEDYGAKAVNVLTGFKYIGEVMNRLESEGRIDDFVIGFEESCGYLVGSHARDKDAVVASMLLAECCAFHKNRGKSMVSRLLELYRQYGQYSHKLLSKKFSGASGNEKMKQLLQQFRKLNLSQISGKRVLERIDLMDADNRMGLPKSDVVIFNLEDNAQFIMRPSGTEPLIKFYLTAAETPEKNKKTFSGMETLVDGVFR